MCIRKEVNNFLTMRICYIKASHSLLEPYEGKLSCTVLRGESPREGADLLDPFMKKLGLTNLQLGLSGYNLLTFTPFIWGDPESRVDTGPSYPLQRTYTATLKVGF